MSEEIEVRINGENRSVPEGLTVEELLGELELDPRAVVVEKNREIVRRGDVDREPVEEGDVLEIVRFVGGG